MEHVDVLSSARAWAGSAWPTTCRSSSRTGFVLLEAQDDRRRHLVDPPLPGRALRQRPVHLRLPLEALAGAVDRRGRGDPQLPRRGDRGDRPRPAHPLPPQGDRGELVQRGRALGRRGDPDRHRRGAPVHDRVPLDVPGLLRPRQAVPAAVAGDGRVRRPGPAPAALARGPRPDRQGGRGHRLRVDRRDDGAGDRPAGRARDDAAALARRTSSRRPWCTSWPRP